MEYLEFNGSKVKLDSIHKTLKIHLVLFFILLFFTLFACIVLTTGIILVLQSDFAKSMNSQTPTILDTIQNYLKVIIPYQLTKFNLLTDQINSTLIHFNFILDQLYPILNKTQNIVDIPHLNDTLGLILNKSVLVLQAIIDANLTQVAVDVHTIAVDINKVLNGT